jgi:GlpG protein
VTVLVCAAAIIVWMVEASGRSCARMNMDVLAFHGEPWRIFTSALPHVGIIHLAFNVYWTWHFGGILERRFGSPALALFVLLFDAGATLAEFAMFGAGVGLSGVGYGLFGLLWMLQTRDMSFFGVLHRNTIIGFVAWFFICILTTISGTYTVANAAHGAGALLGILVGLSVTSSGLRRAAYGALVPAVVATSLAGATVARPWVNVSKKTVGGLLMRGIALDNDGRCEEAPLYYQEALRLDPKNVRIAVFILEDYLALDQEEKADILWRESTRIDPTDPVLRAVGTEIKLRLAYRSLMAGHTEEAIGLSKQGLALGDRAVGWHNLGVAYMRANRLQDAADAFERAQKGYPLRRELVGKLGHGSEPLRDFADRRHPLEPNDDED